MTRDGAHETEYNPFLISELIIDNCGTPDAVFAHLLQGIAGQDHLSSLSYVNYNEIGPKTLQKLHQVFDCNTLQELNLTNIKIEQPLTAELLQDLLPMSSLLHLKLSDINLNHPSITPILLELL
jgi:hypothetical protein